MTIQEWGAIGELVGGVAVIATLVYLALQIRQNTRSIEGSTEQSLMNHEMSTYTFIAEHPSIYRRGCADMAELDADEAVVFENLVFAIMSQIYSAYAQYRRHLVPESVWDAYLIDWSEYLELPGFQKAWDTHKASYPVDFIQALYKGSS